MPAGRLRLLTRAGCHLCEAARRQLAEVCAGAGEPMEEIDVDSDPGLAARFGEYVPVIMVDGRVVGWLRIEEAAVRAALAASPAARSGD
jgi:glutaredoxin